MLHPHLPTLDDIESNTIPAGFPKVIDTHVHIFPDHIFKAIRRWFDDYAWHIRYQLSTSEVFDFLLSHGVCHIIALQYAHHPGIAGDLNQYMAKQCQPYPHDLFADGVGLSTRVCAGHEHTVFLVDHNHLGRPHDFGVALRDLDIVSFCF